MRCESCGYEGPMRANYLEAVWQEVAGTPDDYDYTGHTGTYDDGSTQDESLSCPECFDDVATFGTHVFVEEGAVAKLRESTGYDPDVDGSVDALIAYKDALEDLVGGS